MQLRELVEDLVPRFLEMHFNQPPIGVADLASYQTECLAARHERNDAVMLRLQPLC